jgi:hypothetical protein
MASGILPGSAGEPALQERLGTEERAARFYGSQVTDRLNASSSGLPPSRPRHITCPPDARARACAGCGAAPRCAGVRCFSG